MGAGIGDNLKIEKAVVEERIDENEGTELQIEKIESGK